MASTPSCGASSQPVGRCISKRRIWSKREEDVPLIALKEIIQDGWKCENGFRTGYLNQLEKVMRRHFPQSDLRSEPHIGNKIHVWKKNHASIQGMLSRSGFEWDDKQHMVVFREQSVFDEYVKTDNHAKTMKHKSYPNYGDPNYGEWCEVFGADRATGEHAEDINTAAVNPLKENVENTADNVDEHNGVSGENDTTSYMQESGKSTGKSTKRKRQHFEQGASEQLVTLMGKFCEQTNANLQAIANRIGYDFELSGKRGKLFEALGALGVLNVDQQLCAAKILANNKADLELFFSLPDEARGRMVIMLVNGRI